MVRFARELLISVVCYYARTCGMAQASTIQPNGEAIGGRLLCSLLAAVYDMYYAIRLLYELRERGEPMPLTSSLKPWERYCDPDTPNGLIALEGGRPPLHPSRYHPRSSR